jgi:hypothetical protein
MMLGASMPRALAAIVAWLALVTVAGLRAVEIDVPHLAVVAAALLGGPIAIVAALQVIGSIWRGPAIRRFSRNESVHCGAEYAAVVRQGAQLRGTMGGAGHLHPRRLVFPAVAWGAAAFAGVEILAHPTAPAGAVWAAIVAVAAVAGAFLFPAKPYYYREATGGGVVVSPPEAAVWLAERACPSVADAGPSSGTAHAPGAAPGARGAAPRAAAVAGARSSERNLPP